MSPSPPDNRRCGGPSLLQRRRFDVRSGGRSPTTIKDVPMTDQPSTASTSAAAANRMQDNPAAKKQLRADIGSKWGKFSADELAGLKDNDDLVAQLVAKYGLD